MNSFSVKNQKGVALLLVVVTVGAAAILIAITASYIGLNQLESSFASTRGVEASAAAQGCMDEAFHRIRLNQDYGLLTSPISLSLGNASCIIEVSDLGGSQRRIIATGTSGDYNKKYQADITRNGRQITIDSWQEVTN